MNTLFMFMYNEYLTNIHVHEHLIYIHVHEYLTNIHVHEHPIYLHVQ